MKGKNDMGIFKIFGYGLGSMSNNLIMGVWNSGNGSFCYFSDFKNLGCSERSDDGSNRGQESGDPFRKIQAVYFICIPSTGNCGIPVLLYTELQCWRQDRICGYYIHVVWYDLYSI